MPCRSSVPCLTFAACFHLSTMARVTGRECLLFPLGPPETPSSSSSPSPSLASCTRHRRPGLSRRQRPRASVPGPRPCWALPRPHLQRLGRAVELPLFPLGAVRVAEVEQALVVLLQELVELGVFVLQPRKLVLVLRRVAFTPAEKAGVSRQVAGHAEPGEGGLLASSGKTRASPAPSAAAAASGRGAGSWQLPLPTNLRSTRPTACVPSPRWQHRTLVHERSAAGSAASPDLRRKVGQRAASRPQRASP